MKYGDCLAGALVMAVIDQHDESAPQRFGRLFRPVFCTQIDFGAPADAHLRAGAREIFGQARRGRCVESLDEADRLL